MRRNVPIAVLVAVAAACGGATVAGGALDASSDGSGGDDGGTRETDATAFTDGFIGFEAGTGDALTMAQGQCDPPCADGEYCYAFVFRGGGRHGGRHDNRDPIDGGDGGDGGQASLGCHDVPAQCAPAATCACLLRVVGPECHASTTDCVVDDAGRPTVECVSVAP
jgi:hypothetical protein